MLSYAFLEVGLGPALGSVLMRNGKQGHFGQESDMIRVLFGGRVSSDGRKVASSVGLCGTESFLAHETFSAKTGGVLGNL